MKDCCQKREFLYTLSAGAVSAGCETCGYGARAEIEIERYCKHCRSQQGYSTLADHGSREIESLDELFP